LIIHGEDDQDVQVHHAAKLFEKCHNKYSNMVKQPRMTHNIFGFFDDFINPVNEFFLSCGIINL